MQKLLHLVSEKIVSNFWVFRGSVTCGSRVPGLESEVSIPREHPCPDRCGGDRLLRSELEDWGH
jgi:hypothetical protein